MESETEKVIRAKWSIDGAKTLKEAAEKLQAFAEELLAEESEGWQLDQPVADDYGFAYKREEGE